MTWAMAPTRPTASKEKPRKRKKEKTSTSPLLPSTLRSKKSWLPTWLCHMPLKEKEAIGSERARPLCFPRPKFFTHAVTAARYMEHVAMPMATKANIITPTGYPLSAGGPARYTKPARTYPKQKSIAANNEMGRGE